MGAPEIDRDILDAKLIGEATLDELLAAVRQRSACLVAYVLEQPPGDDRFVHYRRLGGDVTLMLGMIEHLRVYAHKHMLDDAPPI